MFLHMTETYVSDVNTVLLTINMYLSLVFLRQVLSDHTVDRRKAIIQLSCRVVIYACTYIYRRTTIDEIITLNISKRPETKQRYCS